MNYRFSITGVLLAVMLSCASLRSQSFFYAVFEGDTVELNVTGANGTVQWQQTDDSLAGWSNIPGATTNPYTHLTESSVSGFKYYRAEISNPSICLAPWYSSVTAHRVVTDYNQIHVRDYFAGGFVFMVDGVGDGLIAAPADQSSGIQWGCEGSAISGADGSALGTGAQNTLDIVAGCPATDIAAYMADTLTLNGYSDWFLPSKDELNAMYTALKAYGIGSFSNSYYWCSTELTGNNAYCQLFNSGTQNNYSKSTSYFVRCARAFSPPPPPLPVQLRLDSGETPLSIFNSGIPLDSLYGKVYAGGLIFYLDQINGSGMVAAAADQAFAAKWGCYGVQIDGAGNAGIGSGQQNTLDIISGCGTVGIAAYLADTLGLEGFTDWFLPSKDELNLMYLNLQANGLGNFGGGSYWSSTEIDDNLAWLQAFNTGNEMSANKDYDDMVRSARSFGNPWVSTDSITDVSYDVATVYCNVISDGGYSVTQRGVLYGEVSLPTFSDEISSMGSGTGQFTINLSALTPNASYSARSFAINSIDTAYGRVISFLTPLQPLTVQQRLDTNETPISIFNSGVALDSLYGKIYQGGLIFYLNTVSGAGLLAATVDQSMNASWGCENTLIDGADSSGLGYGMQNTLEILAGCAELGIAAYIADTLTLNGYDDWFLPSHGELIEMYNNLMSQGLGNFSNGTYWSSTEYDATYARDVYSLNGFQNLGPKSQQRPIRCARAFGPWPVTDRDGNVYQTVEIGNQHWMQENLRTTKFSDGSPIPSGSDSATWVNLSTPGFCWYNNDSVAYSGEYGALYNWYSVETGNLCPYGWHVPAEWEWNILGKYLDNSLDTTLSGWVGSDVGGKLKEVGLAHWNSPNAGATNSVGFTALPGGYRLGDATYDMIGSYGTWWTATENTTSDAWHRFLYTNNAQVFRDVSIKPIGLSVRCVKD